MSVKGDNMKKIALLVVMLFSLSSVLFGFATLTAPQGGDPIQFSSNVSDVDVYLNNLKVGKIGSTPYTLKVKREDEPKVLTFKKAGYSDQTVALTKAPTSIFWLNFLVGGLLGSSTDSIFTKNNMEYSPNQFFVEMNKL